MTDQETVTTPGQRAALRARYISDPGVINCPVCQEPMLLLPPERRKVGVSWTWRCPRDAGHPLLHHVDYYADLDVIDACEDADALAGARAETVELRTILAATRERLDNTIADLCQSHDDLDAAARTVDRLHALLRRCGPFLAMYQCEGQTEGDELIALEADIAAEQRSRSTGGGA